MLNRIDGKQSKIIITTLEELMPEEHFLRDLDKYVDFSFVYDKLAHLYSNTGRRSVDPVALIKLLLLGFLYNIDSERKLEKEAQVNIAFRWFLGIGLDEAIPDHSTISQNRRRKWQGTSLFEDVFTEVVRRCIKSGLVDGSLILTDSTHIKANASNSRKETVTVSIEPREYIKRLDELCVQEDLKVREEAVSSGRKKRGRQADKSAKTRIVEKSKTDPDCGILKRPGKPTGFHYLNHQSVDGKSGIVTDVFVTPANVKDFEPYVSRIKHQINRFGFSISEVGIDRMYDQEEVHKEMYDMGIKTYTPLIDTEAIRRHSKMYSPADFTYDEGKNTYICPNNCELKYSSVDTSERKKVYRSSRKDCSLCPLRMKCIGGSTITARAIRVSFFKNEVDFQRSNHGTKRYYEVQQKRRIFCEGAFALQKDNHNLRRTRKRGHERVTEHCLCSALALNIKKLVKYLKHKGTPPVLSAS